MPSAPSAWRSTRASAGACTCSAANSPWVALMAMRQAAGLDHPGEASGARGAAASCESKSRKKARQAPDRPSETRMSRMGPGAEWQTVPQPRRFQFATRYRTAMDRRGHRSRVFHRRQAGAVHHCGGDSGIGQTAGKRAAHRPGTHHTNFGLDHIDMPDPAWIRRKNGMPAHELGNGGRYASVRVTMAAYSLVIVAVVGSQSLGRSAESSVGTVFW